MFGFPGFRWSFDHRGARCTGAGGVYLDRPSCARRRCSVLGGRACLTLDGRGWRGLCPGSRCNSRCPLHHTCLLVVRVLYRTNPQLPIKNVTTSHVLHEFLEPGVLLWPESYEVAEPCGGGGVSCEVPRTTSLANIVTISTYHPVESLGNYCVALHPASGLGGRRLRRPCRP